MQRVWLTWSEPLLPAAARWLIDRGPRDGTLVDLGTLRCVLPGRRAGRILLGTLAGLAEGDDLDLVPPRTITPGDLPAACLPPDAAMASRTERTLAWMEALRTVPVDAIAALVHDPAEIDDPVDRFELARSIARLHEELSGYDVEFASVPDRAADLALFGEGDRWTALHRVAERYASILSDLGLEDPNRAERLAMTRGSWIDPGPLVVVGVTELNTVQRSILEHAADRATILVHAPETMAAGFDDVGAVAVDHWTEAVLTIDDEEIVIADRPEEQAECAIDLLATMNGRFAAQEITFGLGDPALAAPLSLAAARAGLDLHVAAGTPLDRTAPCRLLDGIASWMERRSARELAALVRHPDLERWLDDRAAGSETAARSRLTALDEHATEHLGRRATGRWRGSKGDREALDSLWSSITDLLAPLEGGTRSFGEWSDLLLSVLGRVYGDVVVTTEDAALQRTVAACRDLRDALAQHAAAARDLQPGVDAASAIRLVLAGLSDAAVADDARDDQVEALGWLELHHDPAPALILLGVNEGTIPRSVSADQFLPDGLRAALGLADNAFRYAHDAYRLEAIRNARGHVRVVAGRRSPAGDPLAPSRLLLACGRESVVGRVRMLCGDDVLSSAGGVVRPGTDRVGASSRFEVPALPADLAPPATMSVTWFRTYLACPYRFALKHLLRLRAFTDDAVELDPARFGTLAHAVLARFGEDETLRDERDATQIEKGLLDFLREEVRREHGDDPLPAVRLQAARLEQRLAAFARVQAALRRDGWSIRHAECSLRDGVALDVPDQSPMLIRGRIDRIDVHETSGAWRIIDYKTGESASSPYAAHHGVKRLPAEGATEWIDLQLPLYHHLVPQHDAEISGRIELGYIVLPKRASDVDLLLAQWTPAHLASAVEKAREVVGKIRAGNFERNLEHDAHFDDFARICQTAALVDADAPGENGEAGDA